MPQDLSVYSTFFDIDNNNSTHFVFQWQVLWDVRKRDCWWHNLWSHQNSKRGPIFCYWALSVSVYCCFLLNCADKLSNVMVSMIQWAHNKLPCFFSYREQPNCAFGGCIQRYTRQPILIWNDTMPYYPPLDFAQFDFPTHCEWANIGQWCGSDEHKVPDVHRAKPRKILKDSGIGQHSVVG